MSAVYVPPSSEPHTTQVNVTLAEYKLLQRIRSESRALLLIDTRTGALTVLGRSENIANGSTVLFMPID